MTSRPALKARARIRCLCVMGMTPLPSTRRYPPPGATTSTHYGKIGSRPAGVAEWAAGASCLAGLRSVFEGASPNSFR